MELNPFVNVLSDSRKLPEECCAVRHRKGYRNTLYTNSLFAVGKKLKAVVADSYYGGIEALKYFQEQNIQTCISPRIHDSSEGRYRNTDFTVIRDGERNGVSSRHRVHKQTNNVFRTQFPRLKQLCNACALKDRSTKSIHGKIISFYKGKYFSNAKILVNSHMGKKILRAQGRS
jgi:hypothetical protein